MKKNLPLAIAFTVGMFMVIEYFIPHPYVQIPSDLIMEWGKVIAGATFLLGIASLIQVNIPKVINRQEDWIYKLVLLLGFALTMILSFWGIETGTSFHFIFMKIMRPMGATMFALLAFYIASAAFRAFRARTVDATLMLIAAIIVMLGRVPLGEFLFNPLTQWLGAWFNNPDLTMVHVMEWIMNVPNLAGKRAIIVGAALGIMSTSMRIILGLERSYMGAGGKQ